MIAGEDPEVCVRLRQHGWKLLRIDAEMTLHDAAMSRWTQWWKRALRTGHTTAELLAKYGAAPEHRRLRRALSAVIWAVVVPVFWIALFAAALALHSLPLLVAAVVLPAIVYALQLARIARRCRRAGRSAADARAYAFSCLLAKWPETWGMLLYVARRSAGRKARWIEYKDGPRGLVTVDRPRTTTNAG